VKSWGLLTQAWIHYRNWITVNSVTSKLRNGTITPTFEFKDDNSTFLLDSATTGIYVDHDTAMEIMRGVPITNFVPGKFPDIRCSAKFDTGELIFGFGNNTIHVPYASLVLEVAVDECIFTLTSREKTATDLNILGCKLTHIP
jgi:hypothetical protein